MLENRPMKRLIVAITGASGASYGVRALELLQELPHVESHLIVSHGSRSTLHHETGITVRDVSALADVVHQDNDLGAAVSSGSFPIDGMLVAPCSVKTLSAVANCDSSTLVARAADVTLKEGRPLVLMLRECPLHRGHIRLMDLAAASGSVIFPPVPAMYIQPGSVADIVDHSVRRALERVGIELDDTVRWKGLGREPVGSRQS